MCISFSKGISTIIAVILMLLIILGLVSITYFFILGSFSRGTLQSFYIIDMHNDTVFIQNIGTKQITDVTARVDGQEAAIAVVPDIPSLVAHWSFNEGSGDIAHDTSGRGHHGTLIDMELGDWVDGVFGKALEFDDCAPLPAGSEYVYIPDSVPGSDLQVGTQVTVDMWVSIISQEDSSEEFFAKYTAKYQALDTGTNGNNGILWNWDVATDNVWSFGEWFHIAYTSNIAGPEGRLYINGQEVYNSPVAQTKLPWASADIRLGCACVAGTSTFHGRLDEVRIFNKQLSSSEIGQLYSGFIPTGQSAKIVFLTPLSRGKHNIRICTPSMCAKGILTIF
jgi:hypothetical protein